MRGTSALCVIGGALMTAALIVWSMYLRAEDASFRSTAVHADARVIGPADVIRRDHDGNLERHKFDLYEFETASGQIARFTSPVTVLQPRRPPGAHAPVLHAPNDPTDVRVDDASNTEAARWMLWCSPIGLAFSALFFFIGRRSQRAVVAS